MRVFLTGATGYIGSVVAEYLLRAGHQVTGMARSQAAAEKLLAAGVSPFEGDLSSPTGLSVPPNADAVIHTAIAWGPDAGKFDEAAVRAMLAAVSGSGKPFVYTSGVWVIGDTKGRVAGEMASLRPPAIVSWRPAVERLVLDAAAEGICGVVIRPAVVYGRAGGRIGAMAKEARLTRVVRVPGNGENHWSFVNVDALADLYVRALLRRPCGEMFLAADGPAFTVRKVAQSVAEAYGARVEFESIEEARARMGAPLADAQTMDQQIMSTKAGRILGWAPHFPSVLDEIGSGSYRL